MSFHAPLLRRPGFRLKRIVRRSRKDEDGTPCCDRVGAGGAGNFVKMVHHGIESGDLQLICEAVCGRCLSALKDERVD